MRNISGRDCIKLRIENICRMNERIKHNGKGVMKSSGVSEKNGSDNLSEHRRPM